MTECGSQRSPFAVTLAVVTAAWVAAGTLACTETPRAGIGEACNQHSDCVDHAQCLGDTCAPRCFEHSDCGGGFVCSEFGLCESVDSTVGDACQRELDCGPAQACALDARDRDADGRLEATCQTEGSGTVTGGSCDQDADCKTGICALGRCSEVCNAESDCPNALACVDIPRVLADGEPMYRGCLQASGVLVDSYELTAASESLRIPVPSHAASFAVVAQVEDKAQLVGATRVVDPRGNLLYQDSASFYDNPVRYQPGRGISTLLLPNTPDVPLREGTYNIDVASLGTSGTNANAIPRVRVVYKLERPAAPGTTIDLNFYFLNLADHPCAKEFDDNRLSAAQAASSDSFRLLYLLEINNIFDKAGLSIGSVTYSDILDRPDLDSVAPGELPALLSLSTTDSGLNIFFVRSIDPAGVHALAGGTPGTPALAGTAASGIAVAAETLCYRTWPQLARSTAHAMARQLGLFRNVEPDGHEDPISDSDTSSNNLMYFSEFGGADISAGQAQILRRNPVIR